jgi:hypothetical protein
MTIHKNFAADLEEFNGLQRNIFTNNDFRGQSLYKAMKGV